MNWIQRLKTFFGPRGPVPAPDMSAVLRTSGRKMVKELWSTDHTRRVLILQRKEGTFTYAVFLWDTSDWDTVGRAFWMEQTKLNTVTDSAASAERIAREEFSDLKETEANRLPVTD